MYLLCFLISYNGYSQTAENYVRQGYEKFNNKNYKGALADFNNAIRLTPNDGTLYTGRGLIKKNLQDFKGAITDYNKTIALNPNDADAYCNRGILKISTNNTDGACLDFKKAEKIGRKGAAELIKKFCK